jgi:hypothetical protein
MDQSSLVFKEIIERRCPEMKPQKGRLVEYLLENRFAPRTIELAAKHFILNSVTISGVELDGEFCLLGTLQTDGGRELVRKGFIPVGSCSNGDLVLLDIGNEFGAVRYVCHETCYDIGSPDSSIVVASTLGEFVRKLEKREIGSDFFEESWRSKRENREKDEPIDAPKSPIVREFES